MNSVDLYKYSRIHPSLFRLDISLVNAPTEGAVAEEQEDTVGTLVAAVAVVAEVEVAVHATHVVRRVTSLGSVPRALA